MVLNSWQTIPSTYTGILIRLVVNLSPNRHCANWKEYAFKGQKHRLDGPARDLGDSTEFWCLGNLVNKESSILLVL